MKISWLVFLIRQIAKDRFCNTFIGSVKAERIISFSKGVNEDIKQIRTFAP